MRLALVGCGYVADFYMRTLRNHPELELVGATDIRPERAKQFCDHHGATPLDRLESVLADPRIELVANLTNPASHYEVSKAALLAGKHVYSEKPLAMSYEQGEELVRLADSKGLQLASAPCSILGETAQTLWRALRREEIGRVRLAYAELDAGPAFFMNPETWLSDSGAPWPYQDEYEVGCTIEHAGYYLTWLMAFFGPVRTVQSYARCLVTDKGVPVKTPDFTVGCLELASGVVARITCGLYAPLDHSLRLIGDGGVLRVDDCWDYGAPVLLHKRTKLGLKAENHPRLAPWIGLGPKPIPLARKPRFAFKGKGANPMDFARGLAEVAAAVREKRACRLSARFGLHVAEVTLALQNPPPGGGVYRTRSEFEPMAPMEWAR
jgi:predicted dehydrogenase